MLVLNEFRNDARVERTAETLTNEGWRVELVALEDEGARTEHPYEVRRVQARSWLERVRPTSASPHPIGEVSPSVRTSSPAVAALKRAILPFHSRSRERSFRRRVLRTTKGRSFDVVHCHDFNTLRCGHLVASRTNAKLIYDTHELWRGRNKLSSDRLGSLIEWFWERRIISQCTAVITVSGSIARWLQSTYGLDPAPTVVRNTPKGGLVPSGNGLLIEDRSPASTTTIVYTGRVSRGRGVTNAIRALALLPDGVELVVLGYGDRDAMAEIHNAASRLARPDRVRVVAPVAPNQVTATIADADMAVVPIEPTCLSYEYCLPNKLFEAVQAGLPVVVSDLPDMTALVEEYKLGEAVDTSDPEVLAAAIERVLLSADDREIIAISASEALSWEQEQLRLMSVYEGLTDQAAVRGNTLR